MIEDFGPERDRELQQQLLDETDHPAGGDTRGGAEAVAVLVGAVSWPRWTKCSPERKPRDGEHVADERRGDTR